MRIAIGSDHAGFEQKQQIADHLREEGYEVVDLGPASDDRVDYPDYAVPVAVAVADHDVDRGILICGTGIGMALAADKVAGVRACSITTPQFAALSRQHNDLNVICLSERFVELQTNLEIVDTFLTEHFDGGRHALRIAKVMQLDPEYLPEIVER